MTPEQLAAQGSEEAHQRALFAMVSMNVKQYPELRWFHAIPNGGARGDSYESAMRRGGMLRAAGVKAGVFDCFLPVKRGNLSGLYIEMKKPGKRNNTSPEQDEFKEFVERQGYAAAVCDNWEEAWRLLMQYLEWK